MTTLINLAIEELIKDHKCWAVGGRHIAGVTYIRFHRAHNKALICIRTCYSHTHKFDVTLYYENDTDQQHRKYCLHVETVDDVAILDVIIKCISIVKEYVKYKLKPGQGLLVSRLHKHDGRISRGIQF